MAPSVPSADAPFGRIGQYSFASAKQADATKQALANAANSDQQKKNDEAAAKLKAGADNANQVYGGSSSKATASAAVTAQNISDASKDAPYGKIGNSAFSSAEQAAKVKEALGKAEASAPANPLAASPSASASTSATTTAAKSATASQTTAASKDAPYGKIGNFAFSSAEQAAKVKEALGNADASQVSEASKTGSSNAATNAQASQAAAQLSADDQKTAKAFETLAKANAAYRNFSANGISSSSGSQSAGTKA